MKSKDWKEYLFKCLPYTLNNSKSLINLKNIKDSDVSLSIFIENTCDLNKIMEFNQRSEFKSMVEENRLVSGSLDRAIILVDKLGEFKKITHKNNLDTIIRKRLLFSGFSTLHDTSNKADLPQLELVEKNHLIELANIGCEFRVILNLDVIKAISSGYGREAIARRVGDLCNTCNLLGDDKNFKVVIDTRPEQYEPIWTFDNILLHREMNFTEKYYNSSFWSSDINEIELFNSYFDREFIMLQSKMTEMKLQLGIESTAEAIFKTVEAKLKKYQSLDGFEYV